MGDADECKNAASAAGYTVVWGPQGGYSDVVHGCSVRFGKKMATSSCKTKEMASAMGIGITSAFAKKKQGADPTANPSTDSRPEQIPRPLRGRLPPMSPACKRIDPGGAGLTITLTAVCAGPLYMPR